jgi:hypothetical protein
MMLEKKLATSSNWSLEKQITYRKPILGITSFNLNTKPQNKSPHESQTTSISSSPRIDRCDIRHLSFCIRSNGHFAGAKPPRAANAISRNARNGEDVQLGHENVRDVHGDDGEGKGNDAVDHWHFGNIRTATFCRTASPRRT